jgi:SNF2 family DNA or RNA helicase
MIPKSAIRDYLARPKRDFRNWKKLSDEQLEKQLARLPLKPPIWAQLRKHQKVCFLIGALYKRFFFCNDTGTGKTIVILALAKYFQATNECQSILVLVPTRVNKAEWVREISKHASDISYCMLTGSSKNKMNQIAETDALLVIETYPGFVRMCCKNETVTKGKRKGKERLVPDKRIINSMMKRFQGLIMDEAVSTKNKRKLPYRICNQLSKACEIVFPMTGTPFGRDPTDLWAQLFLVDRGETLGETLGLFRAAFFKESSNYWGGMDYKFRKEMEPVLNRTLANRSIRYTAEQSDLPRLVSIKKVISLTSDANVYAEKARQAVIAAKGSYREMQNVFLRMRQISSGFLGYYDDDECSKAQFIFPYNPKLESLLGVIESIPPERKIIVYHEFTFSGDSIAASLKRLDIKFVRLSGKTKGDGAAELSSFTSTQGAQVMLLQNSFTSGLNLQIAKVGLFYESPVSLITRKQAVRRFERQESPHTKVFCYDFVVAGTFDQQILNHHKEGGDLFASIIEGEKVKASREASGRQ